MYKQQGSLRFCSLFLLTMYRKKIEDNSLPAGVQGPRLPHRYRLEICVIVFENPAPEPLILARYVVFNKSIEDTCFATNRHEVELLINELGTKIKAYKMQFPHSTRKFAAWSDENVHTLNSMCLKAKIPRLEYWDNSIDLKGLFRRHYRRNSTFKDAAKYLSVEISRNLNEPNSAYWNALKLYKLVQKMNKDKVVFKNTKSKTAKTTKNGTKIPHNNRSKRNSQHFGEIPMESEPVFYGHSNSPTTSYDQISLPTQNFYNGTTINTPVYQNSGQRYVLISFLIPFPRNAPIMPPPILENVPELLYGYQYSGTI